MRSKLSKLLIAVTVTVPSWAQSLDLPFNLEKLGQRATETVDVSLDASMLQLANRFLSKDDPDQENVKHLISKLKGVYVRSFEFDKEDQYSKSDLDGIRSQLRGPTWTHIVGVKSSANKENSDVYVKRNGDEIAGLVVIAAEPKELTIVHIDGAINPEELSQLGGHMGIPKLGKFKSRDKSDDSNSKSKGDE